MDLVINLLFLIMLLYYQLWFGGSELLDLWGSLTVSFSMFCTKMIWIRMNMKHIIFFYLLLWLHYYFFLCLSSSYNNSNKTGALTLSSFSWCVCVVFFQTGSLLFAVFVSSSRNTKNIAHKVCNDLKNGGVRIRLVRIRMG